MSGVNKHPGWQTGQWFVPGVLFLATQLMGGNIGMAKESLRALRFEIEVSASPGRVWQAWTTEQGVKTFFAPGCNIDYRIDGLYEIFFFPDEKPGFRGAEGMRIMAIEPRKMFSFTWNQTPDLAIRPQRTLVSLKFRPAGNNKTSLVLEQTGWGEGDEWDKAYRYFTRAWRDVVLFRLQYRFEHGPVDWLNPPVGAAPQVGS